MKVDHLFETDNSAEQNALHKGFKEQAREYELRLVNGQAGPHTTVSGAWYGGGILPEGGQTAERKAGNDRLPIELRAKGLLKKVAAELEKQRKAGYQIKVCEGVDRKKVHEVEADTDIYKLLVSSLRKDTSSMFEGVQHAVMWYIGRPVDGKRQVYLSVRFNLSKLKPTEGYSDLSYNGLCFTATVDDKAYKALAKRVNTVSKNIPPSYEGGKGEMKAYIHKGAKDTELKTMQRLQSVLAELLAGTKLASKAKGKYDYIKELRYDLKKDSYYELIPVDEPTFMAKLELLTKI